MWTRDDTAPLVKLTCTFEACTSGKQVELPALFFAFLSIIRTLTYALQDWHNVPIYQSSEPVEIGSGIDLHHLDEENRSASRSVLEP